ncbi:MAG: hypothetical protein HPY79_11150 [Bacteroidales bacterium]|nr:hypothetical protein [Bacteroidales bacterium]
MKTNFFLIGIFILASNVNLFSQKPINNSNIVNVSKLTINYSNLRLVNANYVEDGKKGELYIDKANNQLFIVKEIEKNQIITWKGTKRIDYTYNSDGTVDYDKITCEGIPKDCKGEIIKNDNGDIIGGKITIYH